MNDRIKCGRSIAPTGWWCSRDAGHDGSCAAQREITALHQERVIAERVELSEKLDKLRTFVGGAPFQTVPRDEQRRLIRQTLIMSDYLDILDQRIEAFDAA